jgi:transcription elongation GreA/GreB family factor
MNPEKNRLEKRVVLNLFIERFESELRSLVESAKAAHLAATHEESKAEDRHDTFAIEASYLAAGQAARVAELQETVTEFNSYLNSSSAAGRIEVGHWVEYETEGKHHFAFFSVLGGGTKIQVDGLTVQVLSIHSPLGSELLQSRAGDEVTVEIKGQERVFKILSIE